MERIAASDREALEERLLAPDLAVVDPRLLASRPLPASRESAETGGPGEKSLEQLCADKIQGLLDRLGEETLPDLYDTVIGEVERALFRVALERAGSVGGAAELLGIHRNTLARKLAQLGLREGPSRRRA